MAYRFPELKALAYRLFLAYAFYQLGRFFFWCFQAEALQIDSLGTYLRCAYYGTAFDTVAILYTNGLFILLSILPLWVNTQAWYQRMLAWLYFVSNGTAFFIIVGDYTYYTFSKQKMSAAVLHVMGHEENVLQNMWHIVWSPPSLAYIFMLGLWYYAYHKVNIKPKLNPKKWVYYPLGIVYTLFVATLAVGGIRGDFKHSTRPINLVDAYKHVSEPKHGDLVLNSVFSFLRTLNTNTFKASHEIPEAQVQQLIQPIKQYHRSVAQKPNVVVLIIESFAREYHGAFNKHSQIKDFVSYTPFCDSLAQHSLIFSNAFANGRQSIHGMSSVLAGIPALENAFTSSPYANQKIQSLVSVCHDMGYQSSFFHGAANGSMGFLGFSKILGIQNYYGLNEYPKPEDSDGIWGIWDEPFMQFMAKNMQKDQQKPFLSVLFSLSSHHPFALPKQYEQKFKPGPLEIHRCIRYTDFALKQFFASAQKMPWYQNTIFVITADHTNQIHYPEYQKVINNYAVPILFFSPNPAYALQGERRDLAQQIDIYPTLADLLGYQKPIRSWGNSLFDAAGQKHKIVVNSTGSNHHFIIGDYIYVANDQAVHGLYQLEDKALQHNLIQQRNSPEIALGKRKAMAWLQDYYNRIVEQKLSATK
jgi:phosphoglycerol transferase MdoB-like AlkP superfamily enzyme